MIKIRKFNPRFDKEAVRHIACETAYMGDSLEVFMDGRELFADLMTNYYTDYEPQSCFVAVPQSQPRPVGYLLGTVNTKREKRIRRMYIYPRVVLNFLIGNYDISLRTVQHSLRCFKAFFVDGRPSIPLSKYPAHFHINLLSGFRGRGIGTQLLNRFISYLVSNAVPGVHLITTTNNEKAISLYKKFNFEIAQELPTSVWNDIDSTEGQEVKNLLFTKSLSQGSIDSD